MHSCKRISNWPFWFARYREIGAMPQIKCNAKKQQKPNINWMSRLSSLKFVLWQQSVSPCIEMNWMCVSKSNCQTMCQFTSLQAHTYSLCAAVAGRCYKIDGSIMDLKLQADYTPRNLARELTVMAVCQYSQCCDRINYIFVISEILSMNT